ncbi:MAG: hypothetical protein DME33_06840 [Verrucomicrobia bacterium]|nr:MAG: hypothetical protein DME33_06840 [Verrucomicrobiota bacterium]
MKPRKSTETWQKTRKPNLLRHKSGRYYARAFAGGKEVWKSLKTSHYSVAEAKLAEFRRIGKSGASPKWIARSGRPRFARLRLRHDIITRSRDDNMCLRWRRTRGLFMPTRQKN